MSALSDAYRDIAQRHLIAAKIVLESGLHEIAVFHCYHSFESIASAAICLNGDVPLRHSAKIQQFTMLFRRRSFWRGVSAVALSIAPLRNIALYPDSSDLVQRGALFSHEQATRLINRVEGAVRATVAALDL